MLCSILLDVKCRNTNIQLRSDSYIFDVECLSTINSIVLTSILLDVECRNRSRQLSSEIYIVRR
jgi:hypothetical protein